MKYQVGDLVVKLVAWPFWLTSWLLGAIIVACKTGFQRGLNDGEYFSEKI